MDEDQKKRIAVFRFGAIANLVGGIVLDRGDHAWGGVDSGEVRLPVADPGFGTQSVEPSHLTALDQTV
jgi:hypothetical protein